MQAEPNRYRERCWAQTLHTLRCQKNGCWLVRVPSEGGARYALCPLHAKIALEDPDTLILWRGGKP